MDPKNLNKYLYIDKTPTWLIRCIYSVGILTWFSVMYGYVLFFYVNPIFFLIIAPVVSYLFFYHVLSYGIMLCYKQFNLIDHKALVGFYNLRKLSHSKTDYPLVDIFLPICGEETDVIKNTFDAVSKLDYPRFKVYVLDDRGDTSHEQLAKEYNFVYMSRENKGEMKKAGNLKHGFERSVGEFIAVFDADFAPHPDFIHELLPYMKDPKVGIVQSPQYFQTSRAVHKTSALQYGAAHVQEDFYRIIQVARSRLGAPICCGSNAIYRRSALNAVGGTVQIEHSEDAYTGFELMNKGYTVLFIPVILAVGLCPDNLHSYFHQQHRWCSGSLSMMLSKRFWNSKLSIIQKLCYISGFLYYLSHPITLLISFQTFFVLFLYYDTLSLYNAIPFIPCMVFCFLIIPMIRITPMRFGGFLARNAYVYSYSHATIVAFFRKSVGWQPTNTKRSDVSKEYLEQIKFLAVYFLLYISLCAFSVGLGTIDIFNVNSYSLLFWIFYSLISNTLILVYLYLLMDQIKKRKVVSLAERIQLMLWRLKTAGLYTTTGVFFVSFGLLTGNIVEDKRIPNVLAAEVIIVPETTPLVIAIAEPVIFEDKVIPVAESVKIVFTQDLMLGDEHDEVKLLQKFLNTNSYILVEEESGAPGRETKYFGPWTEKALRAYQKANNLFESGTLDSTTRDYIQDNL